MSGTPNVSNNVEEKSTDSSSTPTTPSPDVKQRKGFLHYLYKMFTDFLFVVFIFSVILSYVENLSSPTVRKARAPEPFFSENSTVRDYWKGEVFRGFKDASYYESSFFFFYAPWDRESQQARQTMETVADFFGESDILIAAVNCWYPVSDCAKEFGGKGGTGNILPVFIYYPKQLSGIQYRGVLSARDIIRFLIKSRNSISHIHSVEHFNHLQVEFDNVLVGYLPATLSYRPDPNHQEIQKVAYSLQEVFPEKLVAVAVVTAPQVAKQLHLHPTQPVRLVTNNNTYVYPNKSVDAEKLLVWTLTHYNDAVPTWLSLSGSKSFQLKRVLEGGSGNVLFMIGPRPLLNSDPMYHVLRQVSTDYLNCDKSRVVDNLVERLKQYNSNNHRRTAPVPSCEEGDSVTTPNSCHLRSWSWEGGGAWPACETSLSCATNLTDCNLRRERRRRPNSYYDVNVGLMLGEVAALAEREHKINGGAAVEEEEELRQGHSLATTMEVVDVTGLGCNSNKTLRMYRVDSDRYHSLLTSLGLDEHPLPTVAIVSSADESVYAPSYFRASHLVEDLNRVLADWHGGRLTGRPGYRSTSREARVRYKAEPSDLNDSVIEEINAATFSEVTSSNKDVVLLYTSRFCTHCTAAAYVFHAVKIQLENLQSIKFLVVDAAENDLNWEFTTLSYPTILYLPKHRSEQSRVFPSSKRLDPLNLIAFITSNLDPVARLTLALNHCSPTCRQRLRLSASGRVQQLVAELRRKGHLRPAVTKPIARKLRYAKSVLYVLSAMESDSSLLESQQMPESYYDAILDTFLPN